MRQGKRERLALLEQRATRARLVRQAQKETPALKVWLDHQEVLDPRERKAILARLEPQGQLVRLAPQARRAQPV